MDTGRAIKPAISSGLCLAVIVSVCLGSPGYAQNPSGDSAAAVRAFRENCLEDYQTFCSGSEEDPVPIQKACLRQSYINLSAKCKHVLQEQSQEQAGEAAQQ
jgi:hypothetical protein